jgi:hypothetical protein
MRVFLSKPDRERYGIEHTDGLEVELSVVMQHEAEELDDYGIDPDEWEKFINSGAVKVWRVIVWLALNRNGHQVPLAEVKFNRRATRYTNESPGKDPATPDPGTPDSGTSGSPTPPPSSDGSG